MTIATTSVTKQGIYRSATGVVNALEPTISIVTVEIDRAVENTTQRVWFPQPVAIKGVMALRGSPSAIGERYANGNQSIGFADSAGAMFCIEKELDPEAVTQEASQGHSDITFIRRQQTAAATSPDDANDNPVFGTGYIDMDTSEDSSGEALPRFVTLVAFGGPEVTACKVWTLDDLGTTATTKTISGLGAASMTFLASADDPTPFATYNDTTKSNSLNSDLSFGYAINNVAEDQGCYTVGGIVHNDPNPVSCTTVISNTKGLTQVTTGGAISYTVDVNNWGVDGFDLTTSATSASAICGGMAVTFSDDIKLASVNTTFPTSSAYTQADVGLTSLLTVMMAVDGPTAYDTATQAALMGETLAVFNDKSVTSHTITYVHGTDTHVNSTEGTINFVLDAWESDPVSPNTAVNIFNTTTPTISATGWSFPVTTHPTTAIKGVALAIGL